MVLVIIRIKVLPEKRRELSQTIHLLIGRLSAEQGCRRYDFCENAEKKNQFFLLEEWDTLENLMNHLKLEQFKILRGVLNLLQEPYEMTFNTVFYPAGLEGF
jgi:quinol monooxygenase YgiN